MFPSYVSKFTFTLYSDKPDYLRRNLCPTKSSQSRFLIRIQNFNIVAAAASRISTASVACSSVISVTFKEQFSEAFIRFEIPANQKTEFKRANEKAYKPSQ